MKLTKKIKKSNISSTYLFFKNNLQIKNKITYISKKFTSIYFKHVIFQYYWH
jgi:hypothetical protein